MLTDVIDARFLPLRAQHLCAFMRRIVVVLIAFCISGTPVPGRAQQFRRNAGPPPAAASPRPIDDARLAAAGIRKLTGRHLTLYTD
jgi:hypothetical protein